VKCPASIWFDVAPFIEVPCARVAGHDGPHEVIRDVYNQPSQYSDENPFGRGRTRTPVAFTWSDALAGGSA